METAHFACSNKQKSGSTIKERLEFYSVPEPNTGCWLWLSGSRGPKNHQYGTLTLNKKTISAHRVSYVEYKGPIEKGLSVMHKCDTTLCINPDHLILGTHTENMHDMIKKNRNPLAVKKTHCQRGHEFNEENTIISIRKDRNNEINRACKTCQRAAQKRIRGRK